MYRFFLVTASLLGIAGSAAALQAGMTVPDDLPRPLVDVRAVDLAVEPFTQWSNAGTLPGAFTSQSHEVRVETVAGRQAVVFDGHGELVSSFPAGATMTGSNPYTVAVWAWNPTVEPEECLVAWSRRRSELGTGAQLNYGTSPRFGAVSHYSWNKDMGFRGGSPPAGRWHHLAVTYDQKTERVFVDGVLNTEDEKTLSIRTGEPVRIGSAGGELYFSGAIAQVQFFGQALNSRQIALLHLQGCGSDRFRAWRHQAMGAQAALSPDQRAVFLRQKIKESSGFVVASSWDSCSLDPACGDLHFALAQALSESGAAHDEVLAACGRGLVSSHPGQVLLWLQTHGTADRYVAAVESLCRHPDLPCLLPILVDEIGSAGDGAAFERFLDVLFRTAVEPAELVEALYNATAWNARARDAYLAFCRSRPDLSRQALAWDLQRGRLLFDKGDFSTATALFQQVHTLYPAGAAKAQLAYCLAESLSKAGRHAEAIALLDRLLQPAEPISRSLAAQTLQLKGQCYVAVGEFDRAVDAFVTVVAEYADAPNAPEVGFLIGYCYALQGDFVRAREAFQCVLRQYPGNEYAGKAAMYIRRIETLT